MLRHWRAETQRWEAVQRDERRDPAYRAGGPRWSTPESGVIVTSSGRSGFPAVNPVLLEDSMGEDEARVTPVAPTTPPRVFEIAGPDDRRALVERHPLEVTASRLDDWAETTGRRGRWFLPDPSVGRRSSVVRQLLRIRTRRRSAAS